MISIILETSTDLINTDSAITYVMTLFQKKKFHTVLMIAGSVVAAKKLYDMYSDKHIRDKYLGKKSKPPNSKYRPNWNDIRTGMHDTMIDMPSRIEGM